MATQTINGDMKVWDVIQQHPETFEVFKRFGCPDMRSGIYALSAHIMKVRWAAKFHHIDVDLLLSDLNQAVARHEKEKTETVH